MWFCKKCDSQYIGIKNIEIYKCCEWDENEEIINFEKEEQTIIYCEDCGNEIKKDSPVSEIAYWR